MKLLLACLLFALPLGAQIVESNLTLLGTTIIRANGIVGAILAEFPSAIGGATNMPFRLYSSNTPFHAGKPADYTICFGWNTTADGNQISTNYGNIEICIEGGYNAVDGREQCEMQIRVRDKTGKLVRVFELQSDMFDSNNQLITLRSSVQLAHGTNGYGQFSSSQIIYQWPGFANGFKIIHDEGRGTQIVPLGLDQILWLTDWDTVALPGSSWMSPGLLYVNTPVVLAPGKPIEMRDAANNTVLKFNPGVRLAGSQQLEFSRGANVFGVTDGKISSPTPGALALFGQSNISVTIPNGGGSPVDGDTVAAWLPITLNGTNGFIRFYK